MKLNHWPLSAPPNRGFTLIELLIVVAIIAILAAIAVPNFLEAQTRAKVTRVKADMRSMVTAIESYRIDNNHYPYRRHKQSNPDNKPPQPEAGSPKDNIRLRQLSVLTTPIAYMTSFYTDIFEKNLTYPNNVIDYFDAEQTSWLMNYINYAKYRKNPEKCVSAESAGWTLVSVGPDGYLGPLEKSSSDGWPYSPAYFKTIWISYDPTNGTISTGNIFNGQNGGYDKFGIRLMTELVKN